MQTGTYISIAGHALLIGWAFFGIHRNPDPLPFEVQSVSVVTGAEFETILAAQRPPEVSAQPAALTPPPETTETPTPAPQPEPAPQATEVPPPAEAPPPDPVPQVLPQPTPPAEVAETTPQPEPPAVEGALLLPPSTRPQPRPADRVAPQAVAPPPPDALPDEVAREATVEEPSEAATPEPPQEATAPEEAATEIVTEAETPAGAPETSIRPRARPAAPVQTAAPAPTPEPASEPDTDAAVAAALAAAQAATETPAPAAPSGPPLSAGEKDALRVAVSSCWNVGSLSTEALGTTVVVTVTMTEDARPVNASIRMTGFSGGSEGAARQAFEAARRAIIRCGANGFALPVEKFAQWREIEMTFNPESMRIR